MAISLKELLIGIISLITGIILSFIVGTNLNTWYPQRPTQPDLALKLLPYVPQAGIIADLIAITSSIIIIVLALSQFNKIAPLALLSLGLNYIFRSLLIVATPIGPSYGTNPYVGLFTQATQLEGMFPSGHIALVTLPFLLATTKPLKQITFSLIILEGLFLLLGRGHYSIDLFGGIVLIHLCHKLSKLIITKLNSK